MTFKRINSRCLTSKAKRILLNDQIIKLITQIKGTNNNIKYLTPSQSSKPARACANALFRFGLTKKKKKKSKKCIINIIIGIRVKWGHAQLLMERGGVSIIMAE